MAKARAAKAVKSEAKDDSNGVLKNALGQIHKAFGDGAIMRLSDSADAAVDGISTGSLSLDLALGGSGFPRGSAGRLHPFE